MFRILQWRHQSVNRAPRMRTSSVTCQLTSLRFRAACRSLFLLLNTNKPKGNTSFLAGDTKQCFICSAAKGTALSSISSSPRSCFWFLHKFPCFWWHRPQREVHLQARPRTSLLGSFLFQLFLLPPWPYSLKPLFSLTDRTNVCFVDLYKFLELDKK